MSIDFTGEYFFFADVALVRHQRGLIGVVSRKLHLINFALHVALTNTCTIQIILVH